MLFKYSAKTRDTLATKKGEIDAPDQATALKSLQEKDLIVYSLLPAANSKSLGALISGFWGITLTDKVRFTETMGSMLTAGLSLTRSLEILITQSGKNMAETVQKVLTEVEAGTPFSSALEKQPEVFPESYSSLAKAGEASGKLAEVMTRLGASMEKQRVFRGKVVGALIYPIVITIVLVAVFIVLMVFVIPQMTDIFKSYDVELPFLTQMMMKISDIMVYYYYYVIIGIILFVIGFKYYYSTSSGKYNLDALFLRAPIFGIVIKQSSVVDFARTLALLIDAGVPIVNGLTIVRDTLGNAIYKNAVTGFIEDVKHGYPLSQSVAKENIFPPFVSQMIVVGEETGTTSARLESIADYYEGEVDKIVKNLSTLIEPIVMVVLGCMVGLLIISVIVPIYQLTASF